MSAEPLGDAAMESERLTGPARAAIAAVTFVGGVIATALAAKAVLRLYWSNYNGATPAQVAWQLLSLAVPITGGLLVARAVVRRGLPRLALSRAAWLRRSVVALCALILAGYAATWAFGVPAVISALTASDIDSYKSALNSRRTDVTAPYPRTSTFVAVPVVPGVIVAYHEMQVAGLWGWGGFVWSIWYPGHTHILKTNLRWIS